MDISRKGGICGDKGNVLIDFFLSKKAKPKPFKKPFLWCTFAPRSAQIYLGGLFYKAFHNFSLSENELHFFSKGGKLLLESSFIPSAK